MPFRLLLVCCLIFFGLVVFSTAVFAEGSKELNANGGHRAYLENSASPFGTDGLVRVYVKQNETIYLGSSAQGVNGGTMYLRSPSGVLYPTGSTSTGRINNRNEEVTGPIAGGYTPFKHLAGESGVWSVFFMGATFSTSLPGSRVSSNSDWPTGSGGDRSGNVAAFDVSVSLSAAATADSDFIKGRAYMNVFSGRLGDFDGQFNGKFQVLTNDGYNYEVDANGLAGHAFVFFSNNKGYKKADGTASYQSENSTTTANLHDPRLIDNIATNDITHKLFFNIPDPNLPATAPIRSNDGTYSDAGTLGTTWLKSTPVLPVIGNFSFIGIEGTSGKAGTFPLNGNISFESNQSGTYTIKIDVDNNGSSAKDVTLTGSAINGINLIPWDGKDATGAVVQGTINASSITVGLKAGEVHFPYIDVENNPSGIKITRAGGGVGTTTVYWDDSNISTSGTTPSNPITQLNGVNSVGAGSNGHKWGSTGYDSDDFGNNKGLDTWAYLLSAPIASAAPVQLRNADLQVVSLTSNKVTPVYCIGETITYTAVIKNNGPDAVSEAKIAFNFPSEFTITAIPTYATTGTVSIIENPTTATKVSAVVDMSNQATITLTITGTVNAQPAGGAILTSASILRPADVTDPDATNPDNVPPTDPDAECNSGTVGCNNIKSHSAAVQVSDISIAATSASKSEGNNVGIFTDMTFTVSLSAPNTGCPVTVNYAIQHVTSNASDFDFTSTPASGTLTFSPGETSKVLTFKVKQDLMVEGNETFSVVLSSPSSGGKITTASATGTINNDDTITQIGITKVDGAESGVNGSFTFTFPGGASFDVDTPVPYTLTGTAAGSGTDYTATGTAGTIIIPAGSNSVTLDLTVNNDGLTEGNETVILTPGTIGNTYNASVTVITPVPVVNIADNDPATLTISNASITEGDSGTQNLTFNVTLSNATGSSFAIDYATANGTALAGEDYIAKSGTLTFTGIAETQTITIQVNGDQKIEQNEAFTLALTGLTKNFGGQLTVVGSPATGTIIDNDNTTTNKIITITPTNGQEFGPKPGVFTFSFPLGVSADQPTTIDFGLTGTAGAADYIGGVTSVTILAGETSATVSLPVLGDNILEGPESVILTTTTVTNSSYLDIVVANSPQTLNIIDDDAANIITGAVTVTEGNNGVTNMIFNVQLDKATGSSFTLGYTISNGTAIAGEDYTTSSGLFSGTLTFSGVPETQQIIVQVNGDQKIEANETLILTLGTPSNTFGNLLAVQNSPATGTITDDDNIPANKIITITKANGYELVGPAASFTFSLPAGVTVDSDTEISYTLAGTATGGGGDYIGATSGTIRIFAGQNSATLNLPVVDDVMLEGDEPVIVTVNGVSNPKYDPFTVSNSGLSLDIIENDNTVMLSSPSTVVEGNSGTKTIEFKVTVALAASLPFTVDFHTTNGTAIAGEDYDAESGTISFAANTPNQVKSIFVTINGDLKIENNETFTVTLDNLSENFGNTLSLSPPVTMTITDDDNIPANKIITIAKTDGAEPGTDGKFILSLPSGITVDAATTVNYILSGTAQGGGIDYIDTQLTPITIPADQNSVTISMVDVVDDYIIEGTESVLMTISSVTNPKYTGFAGNSPVALDIIDDDNTAANNVITLSKVSNGEEPGTKAQFRVSFPTVPNMITAAVPTTVNYTISGSAVSGVDYNALTGTVVIPAGSNSAVIDVLVIDDQVIEPLENIELTLTSATNTISTLTVGPGMVSADIVDNDNNPANNVITLSKVTDGLEPGTNGQFKVSFPSGITSAVDTEVFYTVDPTSTATSGTDYTALSGKVTILAGDNSALIDVKVIDDKIIENTETILLALSSATSSISTLTVLPANLVGVTITDDDNTVGNNIIFISSITNGSEPGANGLFTVSYPTGISSSEATQVTYTISGTAVNGTDYATIPVTVTIPAYANSANINIAVINDQIIEATETVGLTLTLADNTSFNPTVNGTLADIDIADDDNDPANNRIILNAVTNGAEPASPGQFTVGFPTGYTSSEQTIVNYLVGGTATSGADYTALSGTVIIPANSGPVPINIAVLDDNIIEGTETVAITLNNATNSIIASLATLPNSAVSINIEDDEDDDPADNIITLTKTNGSEPGSNPTFIVSYPSGITSSKNTQISYTIGAGGTATSGTDYTTLSGTATILAGSNFATILVPVIDDKIIELTETVELTISGANNGVSTLTWSPLAALSTNIADDDNTPAANTITLSKVTDGSEPGTAAQFKVSFPTGYTSSASTTVTYTVSGTAIAGTDYTALPGTVTIPANTNSVLINVPVLDDQVIEPTETVSLTLTGAINANATMAILPNGAAVTADITDNDNNTSNNNIYFNLVRNGVEGGANPQFEVSFPAGYSSAEPTVIAYGVTGTNTAIFNVDYTVPFSTVTIPAYTNSALIEIPLTNDLILEPTESFQLVLTGATNSIATGLTYQTSSVRADIEDDDNVAANNVISLTKVSDGIEAGTPAVFKVSFPSGYISSVPTTVNYTVSGGTAINGTDFTVSGQVVIPAGSGSANFDVTVLEDQILEDTETVQLTLTDATNSIFTPITVNLAPATANILDDDSAIATNKLIMITPDDGAEVALPGIQNPANFTFRFPFGITSSAPTVISYVLTGTAGGNGTDYTGPVSGTVTIPADQNSVTLTLPVIDDDIVENNETVILTTGLVSNIHVNGISIDNSPAILNITDNDAAALTVTNKTVTEGNSGDTEVEFTVTLNKATGGSFSLGYATGDLSAKAADNDYNAQAASLSFAGNAGESISFKIHVNGDKKIEGDETFNVIFSAPTNTFGGRLTMPVPTATGTILNDDSGAITISSSPGSEANPNPNGASFTFSFPPGVSSDQPTTIYFGLSVGSTATITDDFIFPDLTGSGSVTIPPGVNSQTVILPVVDDAVLEKTETVILTVGSVVNATVTTATATTTITDNDAASVSITTNPTVNENAGTATFKVTLTGNVQEAFTVDYVTSNGTAQAPLDYVSTTGQVSFPAGSATGATQEFTVAINDDNLVEPGETFSASLTGITGLTTIGTATASTTINDNDAASVAISAPTAIDENAGTATFTVTLTGNVHEAFSVTYITSNGTAQAPGDYTHTTGTVDFLAGSVSGTTKTFTVPILNDNLLEPGETFSATLSGIIGLTTIGTATATTTITDNDAAGVSISTNATVSEGTGLATFTVTLTGNVQELFTVNYATSDGGAIAPGDYATTAGTITFPAGSVTGATRNFQVPLVNDGVAEPGETFSATLSGITGLTKIATATATTTITGSDAAGVSLSAPATVNETDGTATFTVTLNGDVQDAFTVNYTTSNGTASAAGDYLTRVGSVTFPAGSANGAVQRFTVDLVNDNFAEPGETFSAILNNISSPLVTMGTATASTTINDDDAAGVSISTNPTVNESAGTATFTVTLTGGVQDAFTVDYATANGTAIAPGDYATNIGTVTFPAGSVNGDVQRFTVNLVNDNLTEPIEMFSATLSNITGLATIATATATTTITDNDAASVAITTNPTVNEVAGTATFTVTLTGNVQQAFTVNYVTGNGTANQPNDYIYTPGSITFQAGSANGDTQTFTVPIFNDQLAEGDETFSATLNSITGGLVTIGTATVSTTIKDDDVASVAISANATVNEAAGIATFTVTLTGGVQNAFTVDYTTANGTAVAPGDYASTTGRITIPAGSANGTVRSFLVPILNDNLIETDETFSADLSNITGGLATIATVTATTTIIDNDVAELSITDVTMTEGDGGTTNMSFAVKLNNATAKPFKVGYTTADCVATTVDNDYVPALAGAVLNFNGLANEIQMITVKINGDKKIEADECFKVILGAISETFGGRLTVNSTQGTATGTIANDDSGEITITKVNGDEQGSVPGSFIFSLPSGVTSGQPITINYTLGGSARSTTPDPDYIGTLTGSATIAAGAERVILNLPVNDDAIVEDDEMVTIDASLSSFYGGITLNGSRPVVTIKDNDVAKLTLSGPVTLVETNTGIPTASFTVTLDKRTTGSFNLKYATADGTAKAGDNDYISNSQILHFAGNAGESYPITIQIKGDRKIEQDESFSLVLSNLSQTFNNRLTIPVTSTTVTIENDDSGTIVIVPADGSEDGTPGIRPASFTFQFSDPDMTADVPITINYGLSGTALSTGTGYDYTANPAIGAITLPANAKSVKLNLDVNDDQIVEGTETVILTTNTGGLPYGITVSNSPQSLNITDNDGAKLAITNATVTEGNSGTQDITFNVKLDRVVGVPFNVSYATANGTATGEDYIGRTGVLNFNGTANEIQKITIQVKGDQRIEQNETFTVTLGMLPNLNNILSIPSPEATGTIIDDDNNMQIILSKVADGEEPLTNARFKVSFVNTSVTSSEATEVSYTIAGTAINGVDYIALNGKVVIPAGSNEAFIDVEVTDDQLIEPTETVILNLTAASSSSSFILPVDVTPVSANIKDNDQVVLTVSNPVVTEGNNGTVTATFNVILSTGTPNGFTVSYNTTDGTATVADNDYTAVNGTLAFNGTAGETHAINVTVKGDQKIERDEKFNMVLNLSDTFGGRLNLIGSPAVGTILDDDNIPANKKITITTTDGMEGLYNGSFTFSFPTGITSDSPTTIPFIMGGTAFKNQDYIAMFSSPVVIPAGVSSLTLPVPVIDDDIMEGTETLQMITGGVGNNRYNGITANTPVPVLNIFDNDYSQLTISSPTIKEGNSGGTLLTFEVKLNGATGAGFTVDYTTADGTATLDDYDYNFVSGTLVFNGMVDGETKTISVWVNGDINIEDNETFRVVLSGLSKTFGGALKISEWPGVGTILNDDVQPVASDDIIMTDEDTPVTFSVTGNDADVDGTVNPGSIKVVTSTVNGTLLFNPDGTFTYTPKDNYNGKDEFTYTVKDNTGIESNVAKVSIVINAVNDAPVARDDIFYVRKDGSLNATVKANDTDLDGDRLNFTVITSPTKGKITSFNPADGSFVYVPDNGFVGIDHFSYRACDAPGLCSTAQVTLYVQPKVTVKLTPSVATITEGDLISVTAEIGEALFQDVNITLNYTGAALLEKDYTLEGDYISMVIPAGKLTTTQKFTIRSIKDFMKEGDELVQVRVQNVNPSDFVDKGQGSDILIKDFYPEDKGTDENANGDINPDPLASPNGDGLGNENFIIHNIERYPDNEVLIFNRWGNKVFQVKGYNNRDKAFAGVANTGLLVNKSSVLVDGVYFFIIYTKDSSGATRINKGSVIIKR